MENIVCRRTAIGGIICHNGCDVDFGVAAPRVPAADPHVGDAFVRGPVFLARPERRVEQVVEKRVVAEDDVPADVEEEPFGRHVGAGEAAGSVRSVRTPGKTVPASTLLAQAAAICSF